MKKFFQLALLAVTAIALTACGGNKGGEASGSASKASEAPQTYKLKYSFGSNSGSNWKAFSVSGPQYETEFKVELEGDNANIIIPVKVAIGDEPLAGSIKGGKMQFDLENSSSKGKVDFELTDDKDWDAEVKKLGKGDTIEFTIKGSTTKELLDKMNGNWGTFSLML